MAVIPGVWTIYGKTRVLVSEGVSAYIPLGALTDIPPTITGETDRDIVASVNEICVKLEIPDHRAPT